MSTPTDDAKKEADEKKAAKAAAAAEREAAKQAASAAAEAEAARNDRAALDRSSAPPRGRYEVRLPRPGYSGIHPTGLRFFDGVAHTNDPAIAEQAKGLGFAVADAAN